LFLQWNPFIQKVSYSKSHGRKFKARVSTAYRHDGADTWALPMHIRAYSFRSRRQILSGKKDNTGTTDARTPANVGRGDLRYPILRREIHALPLAGFGTQKRYNLTRRLRP